MADIFLSYAREDQSRAAQLARALEERGWDVFWDLEIPAGETWRGYIGKNLREASCVVVCWSQHSVASQWVPEEAEEARNSGVLVPVMFEDVEVPLGFRSIQSAPLQHWHGDATDPAFVRFVKDINAVLGERRPAASAVPSDAPREPAGGRHKEAGSRRRLAIWATAGAAVVIVVIIAVLGPFGQGDASRPAGDPGTETGTEQPSTRQPTGDDSGQDDVPARPGDGATARADLSFVGWSFNPNPPRQGQPLDVRIGIKNQGGSRTGAFRVEWWAGVNYPQAAKVWTVPNLDPGASTTLTFRYAGYPSWYAQLPTKVVIDPNGVVSDSDRSNNTWQSTITVER